MKLADQPGRPLQLAIALCLALSPVGASAASALFDFNDFPYYDGPHGPSHPEWNAPYTSAYSCLGKGYCTGREVWGINQDNDGDPGAVFAVRNGIGMEIGFRQWSINWERAGHIDTGNNSESFNLFLANFDTPLRTFAVDISRPSILGQVEIDCCPEVVQDVYEILQVYLWSQPDGQGELVGRFTLTPYDGAPPGDFHVLLTTDLPFLSANFGTALFDDPDCIRGRCGDDSPTGSWEPGYTVDNIFVSTVPEPSTALLLGIGLIALGARSRIQ